MAIYPKYKIAMIQVTQYPFMKIVLSPLILVVYNGCVYILVNNFWVLGGGVYAQILLELRIVIAQLKGLKCQELTSIVDSMVVPYVAIARTSCTSVMVQTFWPYKLVLIFTDLVVGENG